jgi:hypothetical protein
MTPLVVVTPTLTDVVVPNASVNVTVVLPAATAEIVNGDVPDAGETVATPVFADTAVNVPLAPVRVTVCVCPTAVNAIELGEARGSGVGVGDAVGLGVAVAATTLTVIDPTLPLASEIEMVAVPGPTAVTVKVALGVEASRTRALA